MLLPKPGKTLTDASQLRPICLLHPIAKVTASILATRLRPYAVRYLHSVPQFAYLGGRSLQQALDRVVSHCAEVRGLAATQNRNPFAYRQGRETLAVVGRIQLSLDISKAYDCVRRADLKAALQDADVPPDLVSLVLAIHHQALLRVQHGGRSADLPLRVGLRQGCGLSPLLWAVFSGWVLRRLDGEGPGQVTVADTNTTFADDFHFAWLVRSGAALEKAYRDIKAVLAHLEAHRLQISVDKTVVMVELRGNKAATLLRKYTIKTDKGTFMRFQVNSRNIDIKIVTQHTYLGVCISYHKFEQETVAKRIKLAQAQFARLKSVLKCQAVALPLRLRFLEGMCTPVPPSRTRLHWLYYRRGQAAHHSAGAAGEDDCEVLQCVYQGIQCCFYGPSPGCTPCDHRGQGPCRSYQAR